jgi:hypothetical protein
MNDAMHAVVVVHSTSQAMRIAKHLKGRSLEWKLVPVPRHISSDCGVCVRILRADRDAVQAVIDELEMDIQGIEEV